MTGKPRALLFAVATSLAVVSSCDDGLAPGEDGGGVDSGGIDGGGADSGGIDGGGGVVDSGGVDGGGGGGFDSGMALRCRPQAVGGEGGCMDLLGIQWNGVECTELYGCSCTGEDCGAIYPTFSDCWASRRGCDGLCNAQIATAMGACDTVLGTYWTGAACEVLSGCECRGEDCVHGYVDGSECEHFNRSCLGKCDGQDATAMGTCEMVIGVFWNGAGCSTLSGCTCAGMDCANEYASEEECMFAHRGCAP
jgi:hypothetical protein